MTDFQGEIFKTITFSVVILYIKFLKLCSTVIFSHFSFQLKEDYNLPFATGLEFVLLPKVSNNKD